MGSLRDGAATAAIVGGVGAGGAIGYGAYKLVNAVGDGAKWAGRKAAAGTAQAVRTTGNVAGHVGGMVHDPINEVIFQAHNPEWTPAQGEIDRGYTAKYVAANAYDVLKSVFELPADAVAFAQEAPRMAGNFFGAIGQGAIDYASLGYNALMGDPANQPVAPAPPSDFAATGVSGVAPMEEPVLFLE